MKGKSNPKGKNATAGASKKAQVTTIETGGMSRDGETKKILDKCHG